MCTLNIYKCICQLYINKAGKKRKTEAGEVDSGYMPFKIMPKAIKNSLSYRW